MSCVADDGSAERRVLAVNGSVIRTFHKDLYRVEWRCVNIITAAIYQHGGRALTIAAVNLARYWRLNPVRSWNVIGRAELTRVLFRSICRMRYNILRWRHINTRTRIQMFWPIIEACDWLIWVRYRNYMIWYRYLY